ncbi:hypothetical protein [Halobacillus sp. BBL2006]|uniref:hypothetical protein n=1 Tax=Halobacillus sp. BBL2006 TaxID=1543706 RepID=UPI00068A943A|nr:hypothetical protein [Halobacillus sp. BBL2006]
MGYILPINHYQYQDYQRRTIQTDRSPFMLEQVFKATLNSKLKQHDQPREQDRKDYQSQKLYTSADFHAGKAHPHSSQHEKIYSEVTGKGQNFSETI